jgi:hypothetical protein
MNVNPRKAHTRTTLDSQVESGSGRAAVLAILAGVIYGVVIKLIWYVSDPVTASKVGLFVAYPLTIVAAGILGFFFVRRPWRWGAYIIGSYVLLEIILPTGDRNILPIGLLIQVVMCIPCIFAGHIGAWIAGRRK